MGAELTEDYLSRLALQLELEQGADLEVAVSYDRGPWESCGNLRGQEPGRRLLRLMPHRCQSFRLELRGRGACQVLGIGMTTEEGSESPWP